MITECHKARKSQVTNAMYHISQYYFTTITHHTSYITSHNFISKISIEIPHCAPLRGVKRAELPGSGSARMRFPLVAVRSQHAVALSKWQL